ALFLFGHGFFGPCLLNHALRDSARLARAGGRRGCLVFGLLLTMGVIPQHEFAMALHPYDLYDTRSLLTEEERAVQDTVARFTDERVLPIIGNAFDEGRFPKELVPEIAALGLLGAT